MAVEHITWVPGDNGVPVLRRIWLSSLKALHYRCIMCVGPFGDYLTKIETCQAKLCPLHPYRSVYPRYRPVREVIFWRKFRKDQNISLIHTIKTVSGESKKVEANPQNLIRQNCILCLGDRKKVGECGDVYCPLWPFRTGGKNPEGHRKDLEQKGVNLDDYEGV